LGILASRRLLLNEQRTGVPGYALDNYPTGSHQPLMAVAGNASG
jgi:hypothetical protein